MYRNTQNTQFPSQSGSSGPEITVEHSETDWTWLEDVAVEAHQRIIQSGLSVSFWNVTQAIVGILGVSSWREIGCDYRLVPILIYIKNIEAQVNAFIQCFSSARLLATIHDLHIEICKKFCVTTFEEFELGYLELHPLVKTNFNITEGNEICRMTTQELISQLSVHSFKDNYELAKRAFDDLLQRYRVGEKYSGVQMQSLGTYITYLAEAREAEHALLRSIKQNERMRLKSEPQIPSESFDNASCYSDQDLMFDETEIIHTDPSKFPQLQATDEEIRVFVGKLRAACHKFCKDEVLVIMLKQFVRKKRMKEMLFLFRSNPCLGLLGLTVKAIRCGFMDHVLEGTNSQQTMNATNIVNEGHLDDDEKEFISNWKEDCVKYPTSKVSALMLDRYGKYGNDKGHLQYLFTGQSYGRCLLHVAVKVMKAIAFVDKLREGPPTNCDNNMIPVPPRPFGGDTRTTKVDEIIRKIESYFGFDEPTSSNREFPKGKRMVLHGCEAWLRRQFSVTDFSNLGHGEFFEFLKNQASLLPSQILYFIAGAVSQNYVEVSVDNQQIMVMIDQAKTSLGSQSHLDEALISRIVGNQFPSISLSVISTESKTENENRAQTNSISKCSVLFSSTLVLSKGEVELAPDTCHHSVGSKEARECLLKAPILADLVAWSHWDCVFAPSLGPLVHWLLREGYIDGFCCIVTRNGCVIRVGNSSCDEDLSKAFLEGSPVQVASEILSLSCRYNGCHNAPMSLLKQYIKSAIETRIDKNGETIDHISKFILGCFGYLPSEFRVFTAELFVPILRTCNKDAHEIMLSQCNKTEERIMLHDIGLHLGIIEWIDDSKALDLNDADCGSENLASTHTKEKAKEQVINCGFDEGFCIDKTEEKEIRHGNIIIEDIRRKEFGIETNVSSVDSELLKKLHAREGRALSLLSDGLYSHDSHFILELVQNADDNSYLAGVEPTLVFIRESDRIIVLNNEKGFSESNVRSLCDIGRSTKKENGSNSGYIGKKGIGFKSVFRVTDAPEVHSNGFHIKFDKKEGAIGSILPTVIPPCDINYIHENLLCDVEYQPDISTWGTCIVLPFKPKEKCHENDVDYVSSMFDELHPSLLLFLNRLKCMKFNNTLDSDLITMRRETSGDGMVLISQGNQKMNWLVVNQDLDASQVRNDVKMTRISMAFSLKKTINGDYEPNLYNQHVFAFLPVRKYGLSFILQADFSLTSAREEVDHDSAWNQWLLTKFPDLFVIALKSFCQLSCFKDQTGKAITAFMRFIPLIGDVYGFFSHLPNFILSKLRASECLLLEGPGLQWVQPCKAVRGWDGQTRDFLSDALLEKYLGLGYLNKEVVLAHSVANELAVQEYGPKLLVNFMRRVCNEKDGVNNLGGLKWLANWLHSFDASIATNSDENTEADLLNEVREFPIMPLSDGSYVALKEGLVWLPFDDSLSRLGIQCEIDQFPAICSNLRMLNPILFSQEEEVRVGKILRLLTKLGVKHLSPHDVVKNVILPSKLDEETMESKKILMIEFLTFVLYHFKMPCAQCSIEKAEIISKIREKKIILTNHGFKSPNKESIHFGEAYGNTIDVERLVGKTGIMWHELDESYLKTSNNNSQLYDTTKWREFFKDLGVNDFVQVTELNRLISVISLSKDLDKSKYLMELLGDNWDECFISKSNGKIPSEFMKTICDSKWVASSENENLHCPSELFYECESVLSILGTNAPYAIPKISNRDLVKYLGLKDKVEMDDILRAIDSWRKSDTHKASILQMSKLYNRVSDEISSSTERTENFTSNLQVFVPFVSPSDQTESVPGIFLSPSKLYWHDPTGCLDFIRKNNSSSHKDQNFKTISTVYPELREFFVTNCGVFESPNFDEYFEILLHLSIVSSPKESAEKVFQVLTIWAEDLSTGKTNLKKIHELKSKLAQQESTVLPTVSNKWVSLHRSFGLVCWSDNKDLIEEISQCHDVQFLGFSEISGRVADLLRDVGVLPLSEVLFRETIFGAESYDSAKVNMLNWVLPYAQRYICKKHPEIYNFLQESESETISQLCVVNVEELYYKNTVNHISSESVSHRICLLLGNTLYTTPQASYTSIFLELSRVLFHGEPNQELVNFLSTLIFMYQAGFKNQQIESYINETQPLPQLDQNEKNWSLQSLTVPISQEQQPIVLTNTLSVPVPAHQRRAKPFKPNNAKWTNQASTSSNFTTSPPEFSPIYPMSQNFPPIQVRNSPMYNEMQSFQHLNLAPMYNEMQSFQHFNVAPMYNAMQSFQDMKFAVAIGRDGELAAYRYFKELYKNEIVTWENERNESFKPYDITVKKMNGEVHFIEVKATVSQTKDWFAISCNEWRFAIEKGEKFSIAWVFLSRHMNPLITEFKDPAKMCADRSLQLAMHVRNAGGIM